MTENEETFLSTTAEREKESRQYADKLVNKIAAQQSLTDDPDQYHRKAKRLVSADFNGKTLGASTPDDFYVTWFAKVLGNWKAMVSTDLISGRYWEVTYNGDKNETYVDHYGKVSNTAYSDEGYNRRYPNG